MSNTIPPYRELTKDSIQWNGKEERAFVQYHSPGGKIIELSYSGVGKEKKAKQELFRQMGKVAALAEVYGVGPGRTLTLVGKEIKVKTDQKSEQLKDLSKKYKRYRKALKSLSKESKDTILSNDHFSRTGLSKKTLAWQKKRDIENVGELRAFLRGRMQLMEKSGLIRRSALQRFLDPIQAAIRKEKTPPPKISRYGLSEDKAKNDFLNAMNGIGQNIELQEGIPSQSFVDLNRLPCVINKKKFVLGDREGPVHRDAVAAAIKEKIPNEIEENRVLSVLNQNQMGFTVPLFTHLNDNAAFKEKLGIKSDQNLHINTPDGEKSIEVEITETEVRISYHLLLEFANIDDPGKLLARQNATLTFTIPREELQIDAKNVKLPGLQAKYDFGPLRMISLGEMPVDKQQLKQTFKDIMNEEGHAIELEPVDGQNIQIPQQTHRDILRMFYKINNADFSYKESSAQEKILKGVAGDQLFIKGVYDNLNQLLEDDNTLVQKVMRPLNQTLFTAILEPVSFVLTKPDPNSEQKAKRIALAKKIGITNESTVDDRMRQIVLSASEGALIDVSVENETIAITFSCELQYNDTSKDDSPTIATQHAAFTYTFSVDDLRQDPLTFPSLEVSTDWGEIHVLKTLE